MFAGLPVRTLLKETLDVFSLCTMIRNESTQGVLMNHTSSSSRGFGTVRLAGRVLLDMLYPPRCPVCERILLPEETLVCRQCADSLPYVEEPFCMCCGKPLLHPEKELCADCETRGHLFHEGRAVFLYEKKLRLSVNRMKFLNRREYIPFFGKCLSDLYAGMQPFWRAQCLVPVPMHPKKRAMRGYDQAVLLARALSAECGLPVEENLLVRTRLTQSSKKLGRSERRKNLRGVFRIHPEAVIVQSVILIDDIYTTGATMDEAARTLRSAGVERVFFLTLCVGRGSV